MSTSYWMIEGIGLDADKVRLKLNNEKVVKLLVQQRPEDDNLKGMLESKSFEDFNFEAYMDGTLFDNLADLLAFCDDTDSITCGMDGCGGSYFYYPPAMPWHHVANEPQSAEEVHERIIAAVQCVTDLTADEIDKMIDDDLYIIGIG